MAYLLQQLLTDSAARTPERQAVAVGRAAPQLPRARPAEQPGRPRAAGPGGGAGRSGGILAPKSAAAIVAVYGALKAGACYVPLDPKSPAPRLTAIMADSGVAVVLADQATARQAAAMADTVPSCGP